MFLFISVGDDPSSATEEVAELRLELKDCSLSDLEADEVVQWDRSENIVEKGRQFYERWDEIF